MKKFIFAVILCLFTISSFGQVSKSKLDSHKKRINVEIGISYTTLAIGAPLAICGGDKGDKDMFTAGMFNLGVSLVTSLFSLYDTHKYNELVFEYNKNLSQNVSGAISRSVTKSAMNSCTNKVSGNYPTTTPKISNTETKSETKDYPSVHIGIYGGEYVNTPKGEKRYIPHGTTHYGKRGGRYRYSSSGKKVYF